MKRNSLLAAISIAASATLSVGFIKAKPKVIYGEDNRQDVYQVERADVRETADSTVAMIPNKSLKRVEEGFFRVDALTFGEANDLCPEERFRDQPTAAECSGSLVGEDLIATAAHCISKSDCGQYSFVFGYRMKNATSAPEMVPASDVYKCKRVVAREYTNAQDYALVRLDRTVKDHRILNLQRTPAEPNDPIYVIGHPSGLPTKVAGGAHVRAQEGPFFKANLDTYGGNSGSAVFNSSTNEVVGLLVRGETDFVYDSKRQCSVSKRCDNNGCRGEDVTNISYIIEALNRINK
ncbi:MAG: trypsin-like peptidase domain-containing protein [Bdellovibrio sp.]